MGFPLAIPHPRERIRKYVRTYVCFFTYDYKSPTQENWTFQNPILTNPHLYLISYNVSPVITFFCAWRVVIYSYIFKYLFRDVPMRLKPECPKCNSNVNIVVLICGFFCTFCRLKFFISESKSQTKLNIQDGIKV